MLISRTRGFALSIIQFFVSLPAGELARVLGRQLLRSGTSVGAHVREGKRSRTNAEMLSKIEVAQQELEETIYWIDLLVTSNVIRPDTTVGLLKEADELMAMLVAGSRTLKSRRPYR